MWQYIECPKCKYYESNCKNRIGTTAHTCFGFDEKMTNEEWRKTCSAEEFAECMEQYHCDVDTSDVKEILKKEWLEWLKQPHINKE